MMMKILMFNKKAGFEGIVGFLFTFMVLMSLFVGSFYLFVGQLNTQEKLFKENVDQTVQTLREEFDVENVFLDSGRINFNLENLGKDDLKFKFGGRECFEYFIGQNYVLDDNVDLKISDNLGGDFYFIGSGDFASTYLFYNSLSPSDEVVKLVSCLGNFKELNVRADEINWFDGSFNSREELVIGSDVVDRENLVVSHDLDGVNDYNGSDYLNGELSYFCPIRNFEVLNLPFDDYRQNLKDFSIKESTVTLGSLGSIEDSDPAENGGIILRGLDFNSSQFLRVNSFELDNNPHTISFWFKSNFTLNSSSPIRTFFNVSSDYVIGHNYLGTGEIGFYSLDGSGGRLFELVSSTREFVSNRWYNVIVVLDNSNLHKIYINGVLESSSSSSFIGGLSSGLVVGAVQ